jgi:uncharacterized cupredoxin-like copper-binding protein
MIRAVASGRLSLAILAAAGVASAIGIAVVSSAVGSPVTRTVEIAIHYSHYEPSSITVPVGVPVTFVIHNADPIDHEWILGDAAVHALHRLGTELHHSAVPTEVSIDAGQTVRTTITFERPAVLQYICHLPGHEVYGMVGTLTIVSNT